MENVLSSDLIAHIVSEHVYKDLNMRTIKKQKQLKTSVCKELIEHFNICYTDKNISLFRNQNDQIILRNFQTNNRLYLYSEKEDNIVQKTDKNEIILFNNLAGQVVYDANGFPIQKKIKLYIMYM